MKIAHSGCEYFFGCAAVYSESLLSSRLIGHLVDRRFTKASNAESSASERIGLVTMESIPAAFNRTSSSFIA